MSVATYPARMDATLDSGISRWMWLVKWLLAIPHYIVLRVAAYAGLMTDKYPPFKLDMGGPEPAGTMTVALPPAGPVGPTVARAETPPSPQPAPGSEPTQPASPQTSPASPAYGASVFVDRATAVFAGRATASVAGRATAGSADRTPGVDCRTGGVLGHRVRARTDRARCARRRRGCDVGDE